MSQDSLSSPVCSYNEWDPLEEVIVGRLEHAMFPDAQIINRHTFPPNESSFIQQIMSLGGIPYPSEMVETANEDLAKFIELLESAGVKVRQPDVVDYRHPFSSPTWDVPCGFSATNPRDPFLVIGQEIIETPMADRGRYFEAWAYRSLFKEYWRQGAKWISAPKPQLTDELYDLNFEPSEYGDKELRFVTQEFEPAFDGADFVRCGRDIIGQQSHVTNQMGIEWLRRHLGDEFRVHEIKSRSPQAMHIDTTLMPLAPGKVLVNPEWVDVDNLPDYFRNWEVLTAPEPVPGSLPLQVISGWANMNVLMLDETRVVVEQRQEPMIKALEGWGFEPIPCPFENYYLFLGGFHCATLDIRRRGDLQSYE